MNTLPKTSSAGPRTCLNCQKEFKIELEDLAYYKKISIAASAEIPPPSWCPGCRLERRLSFANDWNLFWRNCDKCGKRGLSIFSENQKVIAYCPTCWFSDSWDGAEYAMDYEPHLPFWTQMKELWDKTPKMMLATDYQTVKNCEYANGIGWSKDCFLVFFADYCESVYYSSILNGLRYGMDCLRSTDSELCYECIGINKCYRTFFSEECDACVDCWFCRNCYGCTDCVGCVNIRGESHCIFNEKYTKEEYEKKLKELKPESWKSLQELERKARTFWLSKPKREYTGNSLNVNVTGEYIFESRNSKDLYIVTGAEDCKLCQFVTVPRVRDCMDFSGWGNNVTRAYESYAIGEDSDLICFSFMNWSDSFNLQYCLQNITGKNNFGCFSLKRKSYCILNKQYPKDEFFKLRAEVVENMKKYPYTDKLGRKYYYGEFFPPEWSWFPYNKSNAMRFVLKEREKALSEGYSWEEEKMLEYGISMDAKDLPDTMGETGESVLDEIIQCSSCPRGYRIVKGELDLLRKFGLPLAHKCPKCREKARFARLNKPKFYDRNCEKCGKKIRTAFSPPPAGGGGSSEIVYCEKCYQAEFL